MQPSNRNLVRNCFPTVLCLVVVAVCFACHAADKSQPTQPHRTAIRYADLFELLDFDRELRLTPGGRGYLREWVTDDRDQERRRNDLYYERSSVPRGTYFALVIDEQRTPQLRALGLRMLSPGDEGLDLALLRRLLHSNNHTIRLETVRTLQTSSLAGVDGLLRSVASDERNDDNLRAEAVMGLARHVNKLQNREILLKLAASTSRAVQIESLRTLRRLATENADVKAELLSLTNRFFPRTEKKEADLSAKRRELATLFVLALDNVPQHLRHVENIARPRSLTEWQDRLATGGDPDAGRRVFFHAKGAQCSRCHSHRSRGGTVASDLSDMGRAMSRAKFIEAIVEPSREIPTNYTNWTLVTSSGKVHTGRILEERVGRIVLGTAEGREVELVASDIRKRVAQNVSMMPKDLVAQMTVEEFRDLIAFLKSFP